MSDEEYPQTVLFPSAKRSEITNQVIRAFGIIGFSLHPRIIHVGIVANRAKPTRGGLSIPQRVKC
jgi:hypothetical protein